MNELVGSYESDVMSPPILEDELLAGASFIDAKLEDKPAPSCDFFPHNLTLQPTSLLGRSNELHLAREQLCEGQTRLLTLTGPAGVGKTRLAQEIAADLIPWFPQGVWFVDLTAVHDPGLVSSAVAQAMGVREPGCHVSFACLQSSLSDRELLLVLDNFEQVLPAATDVADLLAACPLLKVVVTSRARLQLRWEHVLPVAPLPYPDARGHLSTQAVSSAPAVALFVERARASRPSFTLTPENMSAVVALCARLDGLPLAIEMAAARANALEPADLLDWLESHLPALSWEAQDLPPRQQSLHDALESSYSMLLPAEQAFCRQLGVFVNGWTLNAAAEVARTNGEMDGLSDDHSKLVDSSLIQTVPTESGDTRFRMLAAMREFALERLEAEDHLDDLRSRHAAYYVRLARSVVHRCEPDPALLYRQVELEHEHDNLLAALGWAIEHRDLEMQELLTGALARVWWTFVHDFAGCEWLVAALARGEDVPPTVRIAALGGLQKLAPVWSEGRGTVVPAPRANWRAHPSEAEHKSEAVRGLGEGAASPSKLASYEGLTESRQSMGTWLEPLMHHGLGLLTHEDGDVGAAREHLERALALYRDMGDLSGAAYVLGTLAADRTQDDRVVARGMAAEALRSARDAGSSRATAWCVFSAAVCLAGSPSAAQVSLLAGVHRLAVAECLPLRPRQRTTYREVAAAARAAIGESAFSAAWSAGLHMTRDELINLALQSVEALTALPDPERMPPAGLNADGLLSPREHQVLTLMAQGLTNKQIAEQLIISVATVNYHVTSVLTKLDAENRTRAVTLATQRGLI